MNAMPWPIAVLRRSARAGWLFAGLCGVVEAPHAATLTPGRAQMKTVRALAVTEA